MPSHFVESELANGNTAEKVDLNLLIGAALVVDVPPGSNITAEVLELLAIPPSAERLIFKTDSTTRCVGQAPADPLAGPTTWPSPRRP